MACLINSTLNCISKIDTALEEIKENFKTFQEVFVAKDKKIDALKRHNERLLKAVNLIKRAKSSKEQSNPIRSRHNLPCLDFDVTFIDDDDDMDPFIDTSLIESISNTTQSEQIVEMDELNFIMPSRGILGSVLDESFLQEQLKINAYLSEPNNMAIDPKACSINREIHKRLNEASHSNLKTIKQQCPSYIKKTTTHSPIVNFSINKFKKCVNDPTPKTIDIKDGEPHVIPSTTDNLSLYDSSGKTKTSTKMISLDDTPKENKLDRHRIVDEKEGKSKSVSKQPHSKYSALKIKQEPKTQESLFQLNNPLFAPTELGSKLDDYVKHPIKLEPQQKRSSIIENIDSENCKNDAKFCGNVSNKMKEQICKGMHQQDCETLIHRTPEGFWNPLLLSFTDNDPRNEVLIDNRFIEKKRAQRD